MTGSTGKSLVTGSRAVTTLATVTLILGGVRVVLSGLVIGLVLKLMSDGPGANPDVLQLTGFLMLVILLPVLLAVATASILCGILMIIAGMGLRRRRPFSRPLTLVLGALGGILAVLYGAQFVSELAGGAPTLEGVGVSLVGLLVHGGYCVMVFGVLLNRGNAAEFTRASPLAPNPPRTK